MKTLCLERTILTTSTSLPGVMRWFEVIQCSTVVLSPVEVAIDNMESMNRKLELLFEQFSSGLEFNINPLTMTLNGVIDAAVMGGFVKYQEVRY